MKTRLVLSSLALCALTASSLAQSPSPVPPPPVQPSDDFMRPPSPGDRGPRGPGGGMQREERKLLKKFDADGNGRLDLAERKAAREEIAKSPQGRGPGGGRGPWRDQNQEPPAPGKKLTPADVEAHPDAPLYEPKTLRTLFLEFEAEDWEKELADFYNSDVEMPAKLTADGRTYEGVGVHFRGASSYMMVGEGRKRSLNLSLDFVHEDQRLHGYRTLNLLNSAGDPTFVRAVLYSHIAREYIPAPKANFARVVINGEDWGVYVNQQQFNKDFLRDFFKTTKGERWHVPGSPGGRGSLAYLGEDVSKYKGIYEIKTKDDKESWAALIKLCKTLTETPPDQLEAALAPMLDIDGALKFLAVEMALINTDGYWTRTSDYSLYRDPRGRFHVIPHDMNEGLKPAEGGRGGRGGRRGGPDGGGTGPGGPPDGPPVGGVEPPQGQASGNPVALDPLVAANDAGKPLISKLLAVPALRTRYLGYVREIAEKWLDWERLGPLVAEYQAVIADAVKVDTRKLSSTEQFTSGVAGEMAEGGGRGPGRNISLKSFADQRRDYLLSHPAVKAAVPEP